MKAVSPPLYEKPSRAWLATLEVVARATKNPHRILPRAVEEWGERYGEKPALISARETLSFADLARRKTVYARWALERGLAKGEAVALMMRNRPDYFALWLGLSEVGVVAALVSPDLAAPALAHALKVSRAKLLIVDPDLLTVARTAEIEVLPHEGVGSLREVVQDISDAPLSESERREVTLDDRALRIFTSGTTGMPKAAEVSHRRIVVWSHWFAGLAGFGADDRHYNSCRCTIASAASSPSARRSSAAARWSSPSAFRPAASSTTSFAGGALRSSISASFAGVSSPRRRAKRKGAMSSDWRSAMALRPMFGGRC